MERSVIRKSSDMQKKLEENRFRRMLEALKGVEVRSVYYADDPAADSWRKVYRQYVKDRRWETPDCLKIPAVSTSEQIYAALTAHNILFAEQTVLLVLSRASGIMMAQLLLLDLPQAAESLWHHEAYWLGGFYAFGFLVIDPQRKLLFDACSDSADEENYRVYTWDFSDVIE